MIEMPRKNYTPEEIVGLLWDVEIVTGKGKTAGEACRELGISEAVYYRWKKEYSGIRVDQAKHLKELEKENNRLKKLLADVMQDNQILKDLNSGNL